jgi:hypothetical protein
VTGAMLEIELVVCDNVVGPLTRDWPNPGPSEVAGRNAINGRAPMFETFYFLFGAIIGLLYPPLTKRWAAIQKFGLFLGLLSLASMLFAISVHWTNLPIVRVAWLIAIVCFLGFQIVGNACRRHHETRASSRPRE